MNERKTALGSELVFLSIIALDGSKITPVKNSTPLEKDYNYTLTCLSITNKLWIASGFFTYIVKLKKDA